MAETSKQKILIVEDNQENIDLLYYFLSPQGYEIQSVTDGVEAVKAVEEDAPDIILLDIMLPKMDGFKVCERLKKDERFKFIPIIMITALRELKDKIKSLEVGADDFITKPFENVELLARVKSLLKLKEYHDRLEIQNQELIDKNTELEQLYNFKDELIKLIVHDMKNPLFVIQGNLQMLAMGIESEAIDMIRRYSQRIEKSSQQLLKMVVNLLDISRIQNNTIELNKDMTDINTTINTILSKIREYPENKNKLIDLKLQENLENLILDSSIIERVFENIINYSIGNISDDGKMEITSQKIGDEIVVTIFDDGKPIPDEYKQKIFEMYSQSEIKKSGYRVSRALGLTFCKLALNAHKGDVKLNPKQGGGNLFSINLPVNSLS